MSRSKFTWALAGLLGAGIAGAFVAGTGSSALAAEAPHAGAKADVMGAGDHKEKIKGHLVFSDAPNGVKVTGEISGLTPGKHGFHVHEKADLSDPKLAGAGGHFNPNKEKHGGPDSHARHAGDWGNIVADENGVAKIDKTFEGVSLTGKENGIVGRSVIVHAKEDDEKTDPAGASGDRVAGGVIVGAKMEKK